MKTKKKLNSNGWDTTDFIRLNMPTIKSSKNPYLKEYVYYCVECDLLFVKTYNDTNHSPLIELGEL